MMGLDNILPKVAQYIEKVQPLLDQHNENRNRFVKRAQQAAGVLVSRGLLSRDKVDGFVDKVAADETGAAVWDLVEKLANCIPSEDIGETVTEKFASGADLDPFEKLALFGDARAEVSTPGMVD